jgi:DNA invertase Pin-like site-specific DNA recombinase
LQKETSIEDQVALCRQRATEQGWVVVEVYTDQALTGTSAHGRKGLRELLDNVRAYRFDVVIAEGLDRISRNVADTAWMHQMMQFYDTEIYTLADNGPVTDLHVTFRGFQHQAFIKDLGQKTRRGQVGTIKRGRVSGSVAYGYKLVRSVEIPTGGRAINEEQAIIVRRIFQEYASGMSSLEIAGRLNAEGIPGAAGRPWRACTIIGSAHKRMGILRNELYRGRLIWGKNQARRIPETGRRTTRRTPDSALEIVEMLHLRIVDDELWSAAQARIRAYREFPLQGRRRPKYLLTGLVFCGECGSGFSLHSHHRYACAGRTQRRICTSRTRVSQDKLEELVLGLVADQLTNPELIESYVDEYIASLQRNLAGWKGEEKHLRGKVADLLRQRERIYDALVGSGETAAKSYLLQKIERLTDSGSKACRDY